MMMACYQTGFLGIYLKDLTSCQKLLNDREGQIKVLMLKQWLNLAEKLFHEFQQKGDVLRSNFHIINIFICPID